MKLKSFKCAYCHNKAAKPVGHVNRALKNNKPLYCDKACAGMKRRIEYAKFKTCSSCDLDFPISDFRKRIMHGREYHVARCKGCEYQISKSQADPERRRIRDNERNRENKHEYNSYQREWRRKNIEKNRLYQSNNIKKNVDEMSDLYISRMLFHVKPKSFPIPYDLIRLKRIQLKAKRTIKIKSHESR